jgi:hypothetical protein
MDNEIWLVLFYFSVRRPELVSGYLKRIILSVILFLYQNAETSSA